ncbi:nucleotidyltransferase family protein [Clostridium paraputrificum]|uniref:nucleotidyltransferase family protein n=1 Tax=Clostridium TaxID=1485 RepID=UPI003D350FAD
MSDIELLREIILKNSILSEIVKAAKKLEIKNYYIGTECIAQTVWNYLSNNDLMYGIYDIDFLYFDDSDLTEKSEQVLSEKINEAFSNIGINFNIKNEARAHLCNEKNFEYNIKAYKSLEEAIESLPTTATAIGIRGEEGQVKVYAPFGLEDLFNKIVRVNKKQVNKDIYYIKVNKWVQTWTDLVIVPWDAL